MYMNKFPMSLIKIGKNVIQIKAFNADNHETSSLSNTPYPAYHTSMSIMYSLLVKLLLDNTRYINVPFSNIIL